jgi:hypothetical protein
MNEPKVLCTGNPNKHNTIASGVKEVYPNTTFIHLSNGYDFTTANLDDLFKTHNIFINASYIAPGLQEKLLDRYIAVGKMGHVFNIGSVYEYDGNGKNPDYVKSKQDLYAASVENNNFRINTTHIILGSVDEQYISPLQIAQQIKWITEQKFKVPVMGMDQEKAAW